MIRTVENATRRNATLAFKATVSALALTSFLGVNSAMAQTGGYASGGLGQYRSQILWFSWGTAGEVNNAGLLNRTNTYTVAGKSLKVTCSLTGITGTGTGNHFNIYKPGSWKGDGLDDLYNQGGTGNANTMAIGLSNRTNGERAEGTLSCSAEYGGLAYSLEGLVFADAEATATSNTGQQEQLGVIIPSTATFRFIESYSANCINTNRRYMVTSSPSGSDIQYAFSAPDNNCETDPNGSGPMGLGFIDGSTSARFFVKGNGTQAIALGVMTYIADLGDAPASYGSPAHVPKFSWTGGQVSPNSAVNILASNFTLATPIQPEIRLGATVDVEPFDVHNPTATGDDTTGAPGAPSDEDAIAGPITTNMLVGGQTYTLKDIACTATPVSAPVYGYIDFNRNGRFDTATERSMMATCSGTDSKVDLSWNVPQDVSGGPSYLRLRIAAVEAEIAMPDTLASSGEVEDHAINLTTARIRLVKDLDGRIEDNDQFTLSVIERNATLTSAVTTGSGGGTNADVATNTVPVSPGNSIILQEVASNASSFANYRRSITCVAGDQDLSGVLPSFDYDAGPDRATWTYTPVAGQDVVCTVKNIGIPTVRVSKTTIGGFGEPANISNINLAGPIDPLITTASGVAVASADRGINVLDPSTSVVLSESTVMDYTLTSAQCVDTVASATGNPASFGALSGNNLTIAPENLRPGARILCAFTNSKAAKLNLSKSLPRGRFFANDQFTLTLLDGNTINAAITTTGEDNFAQGQISLNSLVPGTALTISETAAGASTDLTRYASSWSCTNASVVPGAQTPSGTGSNFSITPAAGDELNCVITNERQTKADLSVTKTNTPDAGPSDQANDVLYPGDATTYVITIRNDGPDDYTGAVVRDPAPAAPLVCPAPQPVTCSGPGCPNAPLSLGQLQDAGGLTLGTIPNGSSLSLRYTCTVE